jgi:AraC family transcriptional regulator, arabinose operon regulatory protein
MREEKGDGFRGQRLVVLPRTVVRAGGAHSLLRGLRPTDAGFFPRADGHLRRRPHGADQAILIYCSAGDGWCDLGGRRHAITAGDLLVVPPGTPHAYGAGDRTPWTIHWIHATGHLVPAFLSILQATPRSPVIALGEDARVVALFEDVLRALEHGYAELDLVYASQALRHLLSAVARRHAPIGHASPGQRVTDLVEFMRQNVDRPLRVATLASIAGLSSSHLTAVFRRHTGYAPLDYFIRLKMLNACTLLDTTSLSVTEVATRVGYDDPLYFSRAFRTVHGVSPLGYRRQRKG